MTFTCSTRRLSSERTKKTYSVRNITVGRVRKSIAIVVPRWLRTKVLHVCDGGRRGRRAGGGMYLATVFLSTVMPSFASSQAMRRRLHGGFSRAMRRISATSSGDSGADRQVRATRRKPRGRLAPGRGPEAPEQAERGQPRPSPAHVRRRQTKPRPRQEQKRAERGQERPSLAHVHRRQTWLRARQAGLRAKRGQASATRAPPTWTTSPGASATSADTCEARTRTSDRSPRTGGQTARCRHGEVFIDDESAFGVEESGSTPAYRRDPGDRTRRGAARFRPCRRSKGACRRREGADERSRCPKAARTRPCQRSSGACRPRTSAREPPAATNDPPPDRRVTARAASSPARPTSEPPGRSFEPRKPPSVARNRGSERPRPVREPRKHDSKPPKPASGPRREPCEARSAPCVAPGRGPELRKPASEIREHDSRLTRPASEAREHGPEVAPLPSAAGLHR